MLAVHVGEYRFGIVAKSYCLTFLIGRASCFVLHSDERLLLVARHVGSVAFQQLRCLAMLMCVAVYL